MPEINNDDLNKLRGGNSIGANFNSAMGEGKQTIDKVQEIIKGINDILGKAQSFKAKAQESREASGQAGLMQSPAPTQAPQYAPVDMQQQKRAIVFIEEEKIIPQIKEFFSNLPENTKEKKLNEILKQFEGNEQVVKSILIQLIKSNTSIKYID